MTKEEPCLETLWLQNIRTMDKVQIIDRSNSYFMFAAATILNNNTSKVVPVLNSLAIKMHGEWR
jgi:hypothetical protein